MNNGVDFFLGSNTPSGFHSFFGELYDAESDWRAFIIKGGPGTGKSGMMKKIAEECDDIGVHPERIRCASDPKSLDALIFEDAKICIADGTSPHIIEPEYPGAVENLIDLGAFWDADKLYSERNEIMDLTLKNRSLHDRCVRFLSSAASLARDLKRIGLGCAEKEKAERWTSRLAARKIGSPTGKIGREKHRFLDAPTPLGIYFFEDTVNELCEDIFIIEDDLGAVSSIITDMVRRYALGSGLDVISCPSPLFPDEAPRHLIIPDISLGILTSDSLNRLDMPGCVKVRSSRFTDNAKLKEFKQRISFSLRTVNELLDEAIISLRDALSTHDELEKLYIEAIDFDKVDEETKKITAVFKAAVS